MINPNKKSIVIGDIHGESKKLLLLLKEIYKRYGKDINVYCTGDLVDRGPDSKGVLDICIQYNIQSILGNHDDVFKQVTNGDLGAIHIHVNPGMSGIKTVQSYGCNYTNMYDKYINSIPDSHKEYIRGLPLYRFLYSQHNDVKVWLLTHAGLNESTHQDILEDSGFLRDKKSILSGFEDMLTTSKNIYEDDILWNHKDSGFADLTPYDIHGQILGHYPKKQPIIRDNLIMIDTGSGKGGQLSCVVLPDIVTISI